MEHHPVIQVDFILYLCLEENPMLFKHIFKVVFIRAIAVITLAWLCSCVEPSPAFATGPTSTHQRIT